MIGVEDGSLHELVQCFLDIVNGYSVPAGTVLLVSSLSQLALDGPLSYAEAFRGAAKIIQQKYCDAVILLHSVPVNFYQLEAETIKSISNFCMWAPKDAGNHMLPAATKNWLECIMCSSNNQPAYTRKGQWPAYMYRNGYVTKISQWVKEVADSIPPPPQ